MKKNIIIIIVVIIVSLFINIIDVNSKNIKTSQYKKINYYNHNNLKRYISYQKLHQNIPIKEIIKNVNMNLDKKYYIDTEPAPYKNTNLILVNKYYYLDNNYVPDNLEIINKEYSTDKKQLVQVAKEAFESLSKEAKKEGYIIKVMSSYRNYNYQKNLYNKYVKIDGIEIADTYSARPGYSEHQTGLAIDVFNDKEAYTNFEKTKEFIWMQEHAHEYGYILRFPKGKEQETGYQFESWHYRYVGTKAAYYIKKNNITLEEFIAKKPLNRG